MFGPKVIYGTKICFIGLGKLGLPCAEAFVKKGFDVSVVVPDSFPKFLNWMVGTDNIHVYEYQQNVVEGLIYEADLIFSLDYNDLTRVGGVGVGSNKLKNIK